MSSSNGQAARCDEYRAVHELHSVMLSRILTGQRGQSSPLGGAQAFESCRGLGTGFPAEDFVRFGFAAHKTLTDETIATCRGTPRPTAFDRVLRGLRGKALPRVLGH